MAKVVIAAGSLAVYRCRVGAASPGRSLACHRDMLAVEDKVLEHAATFHPTPSAASA